MMFVYILVYNFVYIFDYRSCGLSTLQKAKNVSSPDLWTDHPDVSLLAGSITTFYVDTSLDGSTDFRTMVRRKPKSLRTLYCGNGSLHLSIDHTWGNTCHWMDTTRMGTIITKIA